MRGIFVALFVLCVQGCFHPQPKPPTPIPQPLSFDLVACSDPVVANYCNGPAQATFTLSPIGISQSPRVQGVMGGEGYTFVSLLPAIWTSVSLKIEADGYDPLVETVQTADLVRTNAAGLHNFFPLHASYPPPPTRDEILDAHESFQGSVLHTAQFGDLNWWPPAWVSLSEADRAASYAQIASWGDTDITVVASWHYGEPGQPYGTTVPDRDFVSSGQLSTFRALVKEVIQHKAANGKPFVPVVFAEGDNGFSYYMWAMPQIVSALQPQPGDSLDLTRYVNFRMCYDSCVPGWQPPSQVDEAILATRAACPNCVISMEFSSGYPCWGGGDGCGTVNFQSPAGQALDNVDWEGNSWPPNNWEQYYQVLGRLLGPVYHRPPEQVSDPGGSTWYLRGGTPRGRWGVHCFEQYTYQWVRGQVPLDQVPAARRALEAMGCPVIDSPR